MDVMKQLTEITDLETRNVISSAIRYSLQHDTVADNTAALEITDPNKAQQAQQAVAFHRETAALLMELVNRVLATQQAKPVAKKSGKRAN